MCLTKTPRPHIKKVPKRLIPGCTKLASGKCYLTVNFISGYAVRVGLVEKFFSKVPTSYMFQLSSIILFNFYPHSERVDHGRYELRILGDIKQRVYTGSEVKGQNGKLLKVAICYNGEKITSGPLASAKFEILVVKGDFCVSDRRSWTAETFQGSLEEARQEVGSILKDTYISEFVNGEALIEGLTFKDNSSWAKGKKWRLGIRLLGSNGVRVLEAISNCIRVLDRHGKGIFYNYAFCFVRSVILHISHDEFNYVYSNHI